MSQWTFLAESEADTERLGQKLADILPTGTVVALVGTLGAGKTRLVQAVARGLGAAKDDVTSPTFVLVGEYLSGRMPIYHFDAYRLKDEDEFLELGPEEYFAGGGLTFVEWADRVERCLPHQHLKIEIEVTSDTGRRFEISAATTILDPLVQLLGS